MANVQTAVVSRVESFHNDSVIVHLTLPETDPFQPQGGQYIIVNSQKPQANGKPAKRAYTLFRFYPHGFSLAVKKVTDGPGSSYIHSLKVGDTVQFTGPYGKFLIQKDQRTQKVLAVVTDTGITALMSLVQSPEWQQHLPKEKKLVWLQAQGDSFLNKNDIESFFQDWDFETRCIAAPREPNRGVDSVKLLKDCLYRDFEGYLYLAGDGDVIELLKKQALSCGKLETHIRTEYFFHKPKTPDSPGKGMREGFTTGACSAAAAKAATHVLLTGKISDSVHSTLPNGRNVEFPLESTKKGPDHVTCVVVKDGGDDPDCTHGALICAKVKLADNEGVTITGGTGIAKVTKPGLGLEVGTYAINPVPRENIKAMVMEECKGFPVRGIEVEISIPDGVERSKQTLNSRLGLLGGLSILGTTGVVKPYSTSAFIASVVQAIQLASADGTDTLVFTTGSRSEEHAMVIRSDLRESSFIQVGDYIGIGVRNAIRHHIDNIHIVGMFGKLSKMADGRMMTHASGSEVNMKMLATIAKRAGGEPSLCAAIEQGNTARHAWELTANANLSAFPGLICDRVSEKITHFAKAALNVEVTLIDFSGNILAGSIKKMASKEACGQ